MGRSPFDLPDYPITLGKRYRRRDDAPETEPALPAVAVVTTLPRGKVAFDDEATGSSGWLSTAEFREFYDPA